MLFTDDDKPSSELGLRSAGSASAALAWLAVSALFSYYAANFGSFNETYGSLGAVVGFMLWMWLSIIVVLLGAKLNAQIAAIR
jgi:membrane protein